MRQFKALFVLLVFVSGFIFSGPASAAFKLGASEDDSTIANSNKGVIGIRYVKRRNQMGRVQEIYPGTPSVGIIEVGDQILKVDGIDITPLDANQVYQVMAGAPGSSLNLTIYRCHSGDCKIINRRITRKDMNYIPSDDIFRIYKYGQY